MSEPLFRVTAIRPAPDLRMPSIEAYMAVAEAIHDASDMCNASHEVSFAECEAREADIEDAVKVLVDLMADDWLLVRRPVSDPLGLVPE